MWFFPQCIGVVSTVQLSVKKILISQAAEGVNQFSFTGFTFPAKWRYFSFSRFDSCLLLLITVGRTKTVVQQNRVSNFKRLIKQSCMMQNIKVIMSIPSALLLVVAVVEGYSRGAPKSRCDSMHPDHGHGLMAQPNSTNTFIISAGKLVNSTMDIVVSHSHTYVKCG